MPTFLRVEGGEVTGRVSGPKIQPSATLVLADDTMLAQLRDLEAQIYASGRTARVQYDKGALSLPPDSRPFLRIASDKPEIAADGVDAATITFSVLRQDGNVNTNFNGTRTFEVFEGRYLRLVFASGVATKRFKTLNSGLYGIRSTDTYRLESPFSLIAYE